MAAAQPAGDRASAAEKRNPTPEDVLNVATPHVLKLSPDGRVAILRMRRADVENDTYRQKTELLPVAPPGSLRALNVPASAHHFEWLPDGDRFAFIAPSERGDDVWIQTLGADSARRVTQLPADVEDFSIAPSGRHLAATVAVPLARSGGERTQGAPDTAQVGEEIDMGTAMYLKLRGDRLTADAPPPSKQQLWVVDLQRDTARQVADSISVDELQWSPSGDQLALTGVPVRVRAQVPARMPLFRSDLYVYDRAADHIRTVHAGQRGGDTVYDGAVSYASPFWGPSGHRIGFLRTDHSDRFAAVAELGVRDLTRDSTRFVTSAERVELYDPEFHWQRSDAILVEFTRRARRGLFRLSLNDGTVTPVRVSERHASAFSFSADGRRAVWVQEGLGAPPEVFTGRPPFESPRQLTHLNRDLRENVWLPEGQSVEWTSRDGTTVQGWLVRPRRHASSDPPLLVMLHGGPGMPSVNRYHPYQGGWLYPVQVFAARGYAVLLPNYRQTGSFGKAFQQVEAPDQEAVADVRSGIDYLASRGWADPDSVGLLGHSHGAWLGPMVAAAHPTIRAASFAEGASNYLSLYGQWAGWQNRGLHEYVLGASPYDRPERYLELSPALQNRFTKHTPTLLEYGQNGTAIQGLETASALWRHGTPHKLIVYPDAGHGLRAPAVQIESMRRNLRWFARWMPVEAGSSTAR